MTNIGLLILRLALGLTFVGHGGQKLFGWFGGQGLTGTNAMMERLGLHPTWLWALLASLTEFGGGALLALGLLRHSQENFSLASGYYPLETIFLSVAFLALARIPSFEALRYEAPGEWGKILGLDRIPEVRTLRAKLELLCAEGKPVRQWAGTR